ncbi:hypothetical protein LOK49_LG02G02125 [Camellia lanceoleosa]|uniref:Uncharacterized protein n=1 Tax=Camellia lanceoleosa TaxID=1840588 RepID=A0ACC0IS01_9ERIC|nr:hypothetical protein LOK49_LG02G02125 [Camellia lanceoleosa]
MYSRTTSNLNQILGAENRIGVEIGRCFSPLNANPSFFCTDFLAFNGETNLFANLDGENDLLSFAAVDSLGVLLLKPLVGDRERGSIGGDFVLIKNLCGVWRFLAIIGDFVLQNL